MEIEELRQLAKSNGIPHWHNKKRETLEKDLKLKAIKEGRGLARIKTEGSEFIDITEPPDLNYTNLFDDDKLKKPKIQITITEKDSNFFKSIGFKAEWLASIANQYDFDRFHYVHKFRAFRCYQGNKHLDWISLNDLGLLNIKQELTQTLMKHQPLQKNKQIIKLPWR